MISYIKDGRLNRDDYWAVYWTLKGVGEVGTLSFSSELIVFGERERRALGKVGPEKPGYIENDRMHLNGQSYVVHRLP